MAKKVKIILVESVTHDVKRFVLEKPEGYEFTPGQATLVTIDQEGFKDKKNPFTFTSLNQDKVLEFTIKGYPTKKYPEHGGVTEKLHQLKPGDELLIREPWGTINYKEPGVFIAGGAGITPFIAIFKDLHKKGEIEGNTLIFSNKTKKDIILEKAFRKFFKPESLIFTLTREKRDGYKYGRVDEKFLKDNVKDFSQPFYLCGPKEMVNDLKKTLKKLGAKSDSIVFEE